MLAAIPEEFLCRTCEQPAIAAPFLKAYLPNPALTAGP
jgi:hypothetical protein